MNLNLLMGLMCVMLAIILIISFRIMDKHYMSKHYDHQIYCFSKCAHNIKGECQLSKVGILSTGHCGDRR